ncbi:MAG: glycosyltransferase [Gemmatimonadota bacterium]
MRLLLLTSVMPTPYRGTKGAFNAALVAGLREAGDDVQVIAPVPWTDRWRVARGPIPDSGARYPTWYYPPRLAHASHHRWMRRSVLPVVWAIAKQWQPDLILGYWAHPDGTVAVEAARRLGVPSVLLVGGSDIQLLTADPARRAIILETLLAADRVLAVGAPLRARVIALGVPAERVAVFERGVDRSRFGPGDPAEARRALGLPLDRHLVLWVGRMVPVKGLDVLMEAWPRVAAAVDRPLLLLVGDGEERAALEARARALGIDVRFAGTVPHAELATWYRAADLMVLPSRSEGIPNVLLEGLACGTPFVASDVGGVAELVQPGSQAVASGETGPLADAVIAALDRPPMMRGAQPTVRDRHDAIADLRTTLAGVLTSRPAPTSAVAR